MSISWEFHDYPSTHYSVMLLVNTDPGNRKNEPCIQRVKRITPPNVPDWSLCHRRPILKMSWKSIDPFYRNIAKRHATAPRWETVKRSGQAWNSLANCPACRTYDIATRFWVVVICPIIKCLIVLEFSFILFDLCIFITIFNFILNFVLIVTFWIFTYHKIWILLIIYCLI